MKFQNLDAVIALIDFPSHGVLKGDLGAIVHIHNQGEAYEVEFVDMLGHTKAMFSVYPNQIAKMK